MKNIETIIRDFKKEDELACLNIVKKTLTEWDLNECKKDFKEDYDVYRFIIENKEKEIVGFIGYYTPKAKDIFRTPYDKFLYFHIESPVCLDWFAILPEYQGLNLGKQIVKHCEEHAQKRNKKHIATWTVTPGFFKKCGYSKVIGYNEAHDKDYNTILMIKKLYE